MAEFDRIDEQILRVLSQEARLPNTELARRAGLSPSACLRRVAALERRGAIVGYRARLNPAVLGVGVVAYVTVGLSSHTKAAQDTFERAMMAAQEVSECHNVTGGVEYLLRVECADLAAYKQFHAERLGAVPEVNAITTFVVMASPKDDRA